MEKFLTVLLTKSRQTQAFCFTLLLVLIFPLSALAEYVSLNTGDGQYLGHLQNNQYNGFGIYMGNDGGSYIGLFKDHQFHGLGMYIFPEDQPDGVIHQSGFYQNNQLSGEGARLYRDANSTRVAGQWQSGQPSHDMDQVSTQWYEWGAIQVTYNVAYVGEVRYGSEVAEGFGILGYDSGETHVGMFENGVPNGPGVQLNEDYSYVVGEWEEGVLTVINECIGIAPEDVRAVIWPPTDWTSKQAQSGKSPSTWPPSNDPPERFPTEALPMQTPAGDTAMLHYVRFDIKQGDDAAWESVLLKQQIGQQYEGRDGIPAIAIIGFENDTDTIFFDGDASKWMFRLTIPSGMEAGEIFDSQEMRGQAYEPVIIECIEFRSTPVILMRTSQAFDLRTGKSTQEAYIYEGDDFHIEITSISEDGLTYQGVFSCNNGPVRIENGAFRFTLANPD